MKDIICLTLITLFLLSACSSSKANHRKRWPKNQTYQLWKSKQLIIAKKKQRKKIAQKKLSEIKHNKKTNLLSLGPNQRLLLPSLIDPVDGTLMVLVSPHSNHQLNSMKTTSSHPNKLLKTSLKIKTFYIDQTEVTLNQYKKTHPKHDQSHLIENNDCLSCPAIGIKWKEADKHCRKIGKRLPTEEEWELAGRGTSRQSPLWKNKKNKPHANLIGEEDGFIAAAPVGSFPSGAGSYGVMDMIGNVWEWVSMPHSPLPPNLTKKNKKLRISKGGSWASPYHLSSITYRNIVDGDIKNPTFGFRCVKSID